MTGNPMARVGEVVRWHKHRVSQRSDENNLKHLGSVACKCLEDLLLNKDVWGRSDI